MQAPAAPFWSGIGCVFRILVRSWPCISDLGLIWPCISHAGLDLVACFGFGRVLWRIWLCISNSGAGLAVYFGFWGRSGCVSRGWAKSKIHGQIRPRIRHTRPNPTQNRKYTAISAPEWEIHTQIRRRIRNTRPNSPQNPKYTAKSTPE